MSIQVTDSGGQPKNFNVSDDITQKKWPECIKSFTSLLGHHKSQLIPSADQKKTTKDNTSATSTQKSSSVKEKGPAFVLKVITFPVTITVKIFKAFYDAINALVRYVRYERNFWQNLSERSEIATEDKNKLFNLYRAILEQNGPKIIGCASELKSHTINSFVDEKQNTILTKLIENDSIKPSQKLSIIYILKNCGVSFTTNSNGFSPLALACKVGADPSVINALIGHSAQAMVSPTDINAGGEHSPLAVAFSSFPHIKNSHGVQTALVEHMDIDINLPVFTDGTQKINLPLYLLKKPCNEHTLKLFELMLKRSKRECLNVNAQDSDGNTILMQALNNLDKVVNEYQGKDRNEMIIFQAVAVEMILSHPHVDKSIKNVAGKTAKNIAKNLKNCPKGLDLSSLLSVDSD